MFFGISPGRSYRSSENHLTSASLALPFLGIGMKTDHFPSDEHHQMVNTEIRLIIFLAAKEWRSSIQSAKARPGADCGSDHELLIAKFRLEESRENH